MKKTTLAIIVTLSVAITTPLMVQQQAISKLKSENQALLEQVSNLALLNTMTSNRLAQATGQSESAKNQMNELMRLRNEVALLRSRSNLPSDKPSLASLPARNEMPSNFGPSIEQPIPRDLWAFSGYGTPEAALQSVMWAMSNGDLQTMLASMTAEGREAFKRQNENKSEAEMSELLIEESKAVSALRPDRKKSQSDTEVIFTLAVKEEDNGNERFRDEAVARFIKEGDTWSYAP
ncbi:MAG: hypothetical protein SFY81_13635 [Verrucomicrobiota bacterium]|nr:hypothetical protein [Verrucomicrobiota bacterium]